MLVVRLGVAVNDDQNNDGTDHPDRVPALLTTLYAIR
jgi:hypothetical protein